MKGRKISYHPDDPARQPDWRRGETAICLSAPTAIYNTCLLEQPWGLTAALARAKPGAEWHGVVPTPGERAYTRWHQSRAGVQTSARTDDTDTTPFV